MVTVMPLKITRDVLLRGVSIVLRVPALFIVDTWYKTDPLAVHEQWSQLYWKGQNALGGHAYQLVVLVQMLYYSSMSTDSIILYFYQINA